jgi:hypothetical protein
MYVGWSESGDGIETKWRISPADVPIYRLPSGFGQKSGRSGASGRRDSPQASTQVMWTLCSSSPSGDKGALRIKSRNTYAPSLAATSMFPHSSTPSRVWVYRVVIKVSERASFSHVKASRIST